jgi:hypothetical protein
MSYLVARQRLATSVFVSRHFNADGLLRFHPETNWNFPETIITGAPLRMTIQYSEKRP